MQTNQQGSRIVESALDEPQPEGQVSRQVGCLEEQIKLAQEAVWRLREAMLPYLEPYPTRSQKGNDVRPSDQVEIPARSPHRWGLERLTDSVSELRYDIQDIIDHIEN